MTEEGADSMIVFENENARLLFQEIKQQYPRIINRAKTEEVEIREDIALAMYHHARNNRIIILRDKTYLPVYNLIVM